MRKGRLAAIEPVLLLALVACGLFLRLQKLDWDHGHLAHPDERHVLMVADTIQWPESVEQFLDVRSSPLNPFSRPGPGGQRQPETFAYGHFPVYVLKGLSALLEKAAEPLRPLIGDEAAADLARSTNLWQMVYVGRVLSALADAATILVVYALGRRLFGRWVGLLAAALLAFTVLHIQLSHFFAVDTVLALFVTLTLYWLVRVAQGGGSREAVLAGISLALAVASKSSAAALGLAWMGAFALREGPGGWAQRVRLAILSVLAGAITFMVVSPYVVLDLPMFLDSFQKEGGMVRGTYDFPYTRQYRGTIAYLYPILQQLRWGMGWVPGMVAFGGLIWAAVRAARGRASAGTWLVLAWAVPYFLLTGGFMVKFMRYGAPLTPALYVLGAGMLSALATRRRAIAVIIAGAALVYAVLWSLAFSSVYRQPFTRAEASEWIYRNLPAGSVITKEEWDDLIPYGMEIDGRGMSAESRFEVLAFPLQEPDDQAKVDMLVDRLLRADYIIVSSNRFYGWLPRLQDRFPVSNRYYELLFEGQLGFTLVKDFTSYPSLAGRAFPDDKADESFTVYDHPKVMIFGRTGRLSESELRALFEPYLSEGGAAQEDLLLPVAVDDFPTVDDFGWNRWATDGLPAVAWWWLVATAVGLATWPLTQRLLGQLWAGGWALARVVGLLIVAYPVWLLANLGVSANTTGALAGALALLTVASAVIAWRRRRDLVGFARDHWKEMAAAEGMALLAYLAWMGVRLINPDLWHPWWGGERPMEMGFFWAVLKSAQFPPYDPFYAGGIINYYYYGLYLVSCLTKLSGIPPEVAFNLALALFFSLTFSSAFTLGASLVRRRAALAGFGAALAVTVLGNLEGGLLLIRRWAELGAGAPGGDLPLIGWLPRMVAGLAAVLGGGRSGPEYDFWAPSRVIPDTINEFPFFSFLYGDLHPHVLDMPVILTAAAVVLCLYQGSRTGWLRWGRLGLLALLVGTAVATNTWDAPVLVALALGSVALAWARADGRNLGREAITLAAAAAVGVALAYPFLSRYQPPPGGFALAENGSPLMHWLRVWGLFAAVTLGVAGEALGEGRPARSLAAFAALVSRRWRHLPRVLDLTERTEGGRRLTAVSGAALLAALVLAGVLVAAGRAAGAVALALALLSALAAVAAHGRRTSFALGLIALGWAVLLGTELFYLKDWLAGGSAYRMNTVFKFGIQAWLLLAAGGAAMFLRRSRTVERTGYLGGWRVPVLGLAVLTVVYPLLGSATRLASRFPNASPPVGTLDAFAFMSVGAHFWPDETSPIVWASEQEALQWLRGNVEGAPVVAEAALGYYREGGSRVATYTGLPIPLGPQHEGEQRPKAPLGTRSTLVRLLYESADAAETLEVADRLGVTYVYVGQLERIAHGEAVSAKFAQMADMGVLETVFDNGVVAVYQVP